VKLTPSVLIGTLSGSSGGTVASNWKGRPYVRTRVIPHNPQSAAQTTQRGYMARMSTCFRSLAATLVDKLNELGSPRRLSGFNVMTCEDLKHLAASETPEVIPANPDNTALFSAADATSTEDCTIDVTFQSGEADLTHYVCALTCPVEPEETALQEPDGWTLASTPVLVATEAYSGISVTHPGKDYWVVLIVIDTATLDEATKISGGTSCLAVSGTGV